MVDAFAFVRIADRKEEIGIQIVEMDVLVVGSGNDELVVVGKAQGAHHPRVRVFHFVDHFAGWDIKYVDAAVLGAASNVSAVTALMLWMRENL